MKSRILDVHLVLFFSEILSRPDELNSILSFKLGKIFDTIPTILPIPEEAPKELPVVLLRSKDNLYSCNISRSSVDFAITPQKAIEDFLEIAESYDENIISLLGAINEYGKISINRIGFVINYFISNENPTSKISDIYIKKQIGNVDEISIRFNKKRRDGNLFINNVTYISNKELLTNGKKNRGILVQRDVNNQVSKNKLTFDFLKEFIKQRYNEFSKEELEKVVV